MIPVRRLSPRIAVPVLLAFALSACEQEIAAPPAVPTGQGMTDEHADSEHAGHSTAGGPASPREAVGSATGTIRAISDEGRGITISHGPFSGDIQMGAMTMGFELLGDVSLDGLAEGDDVAIEVKQGRDGSFRIQAICRSDSQGAKCLEAQTGP